MRKLLLTTAAVAAAIAGAGEPSFGTFTDTRDGQTYKTVTIGKQTWMAENLNYKTDRYWNYGNDDFDKSWCYDDNKFNCDEYGRLYDWNMAIRACPAGWHLPSRWEWDSLERAVGGKRRFSYERTAAINWYDAGKKLKAKNGWKWNDEYNVSGNGTNDYGFSALPGGYRDTNGDYRFAGDYGVWWTAAERRDGYAYYRGMGSYYDDAFEYSRSKGGYSVRCVRDAAGWFVRRDDTPDRDGVDIDEPYDPHYRNIPEPPIFNPQPHRRRYGLGYASGSGSGIADLLGGLMGGGGLEPAKKVAPPKNYLDCTPQNRGIWGSRSRASVQRVIMENMAALRYAYNKRLRDKPGLTGRINVKFAIDESGRVIFAQLLESTMCDSVIEEAVVNKVRSLMFEKIDKSGDVTEVVYPFVFAQ